jgi:hypothetical protein
VRFLALAYLLSNTPQNLTRVINSFNIFVMNVVTRDGSTFDYVHKQQDTKAFNGMEAKLNH